MKKLYITLFFLFVVFNLKSQVDTSKYKMIGIKGKDTIWILKPNKADEAWEKGDYKTAIDEYKKLWLKEPNTEEYALSLASLYSLSQNIDSAFHYLFIGLKNDSTAFFLNGDLYNLLNDRRWSDIEKQQLQKAEAKMKKKLLYPDIVFELWRIKVKDQAHYTDIGAIEKQHGVNSPLADSLWALKAILNKSNLDRVEEIIGKYGWPKKSVFGSLGSGTAFLVIQHSDLLMQRKYLPLLENACKRKEAEWEDFALMKDRVLMGENKPQLYGTQVRFNDKIKKYELYQLADPKNVEKRRAAFGMISLKDYVSHWNIVFDVPQNK